MKKFLEDLRSELTKRHFDAREIDEILADHEEMIRTALADGLNEDDITSRFGDPARLAEDLDESPKVTPSDPQDPEGFTLWKSFPITEDRMIFDLHLLSEEATVQTSTGPEIRIRYAENPSHSVERSTVERTLSEYQLSFQNGLFLMRTPKKSDFLFSRDRACDLRLLIEIPERAHISDFGFATVSGAVALLNLNADALDLSTTSGDMSIRSLTAGTLRLNTVSGDVHITGAILRELDSNQVSGDMSMKDVHAESVMKIHTVSGDAVIIDSDCGDCEMNSISGDIRGTEFYPRQISLSSLSGDISLTNKEPNRVRIIRQKTRSGEIRIR